MKDECYLVLYELLRAALSSSNEPLTLSRTLSETEWNVLHAECIKQCMAGVSYRAICRLNKEQLPPRKLLLLWTHESQMISGHNRLLNAEAARLTELFAAQGHKTAVLKGPANARLYPDALMRQAGDIDLWVDGGRENVVALMRKLNFDFDNKDLSEHHAHLSKNKNGVIVEIHYKVAPDLKRSSACKILRNFLEKEIQNAERVPEGFYAPSIKFALVMQLSHIQKHVLYSGIGLKQLLDYYILLQHSTEEDRLEVKHMLPSFGFTKICAALMWVLEYVFGLEKSLMLCEPNKRLGKKVLADVHKGGHFGKFKSKGLAPKAHAMKWLDCRIRFFKYVAMAPQEMLLRELNYWISFAKTIPRRIRERRLYLSKRG
jgi:hypothetical protein